ncbi:MAG: DUF2628 domain-containing protein [Clostridia bacterium]|nr:DUF2628 domain-containing protein [Clostridia bacterium]
MRYVGENCPYCGVPFAENDDIVVCPECATPHHRVCWFAHGECAHAELHGTNFVWKKTDEPQPEAKPEQPQNNPHNEPALDVICPDCGTKSPKGTIRCPECGAILIPFANPTGQPPMAQFRPEFDAGENIRGVKSGDIALYCRTAGAGYIRHFRRKVSWNWAALLFSPFWFFYRKLYKAGAIFLTVYLALNLIMIPAEIFAYNSSAQITAEIQELIEPYIDENASGYGGITGILSGGTSLSDEAIKAVNEFTQNNTQRIINEMLLPAIPQYLITFLLVSLRVIAALLANTIYFKKLGADVKEIRSETSDEREVQLRLLHKGGTNIFLGSGMYFICSLLLNAASMLAMR